MSKVYFLIKLLINILLYAFYSFLSIIIWSFIFGAYCYYILETQVPASSDPIHLKIAVFVCILVFVITFLFRWFFYLSLFKSKEQWS